MPSLASFLSVALAASTAAASALPRAAPFEAVKRQSSASSSTASGNLTVDLGYEIYEGHLNETSGINQWNGIRFAAPPTGSLRWQAPQPPTVNRSQVIDALNYGPMCVQNGDAPGPSPSSGQEDCLFLNVQAPANASNLPVFVWIHGGGYGLGNGRQNLAPIINENGNNFVGVSIQYRLGAFGFMSSDELFRRGVVNAGLLDQHFALQWVQSYIGMFGGNSSQVTISGESAGAGSVMLQGMAYGGTLGDSLFTNLHVASPYLPMQYGYKDWVPSQSYYAFATHVGCTDTNAYGGSSRTIFDCLMAQNSTTLMNASAAVSESGTFGTWGFLPVTDGVFIQQTPSQQLLERKVNGRNMLSGNNAEEGTLFTPQNITTEADLIDWLHLTFPLFTDDDISRILLFYPGGTNASVTMPGDRFATNGLTGASALNESATGTGPLERAENIYAETTFVCPSYWLAEAYTGNDRSAYKYQYSVVPATHGQDVAVYFGPHQPWVGADMSRAFMSILGNFATTDNPSINNSIANGGNDSTTVNPASHWPAFSLAQPYQINLNQTGGHEVTVNGTTTLGIGNLGNITIYEGPGFKNDITLVNAWTWEQGRGVRCAFWRSVAAIVPE